MATSTTGEPKTLDGDELLLQQVRDHAKVMEANVFDFLDKNGRMTRNSESWVTFRVTFQDGKVFNLPRRLQAQFESLKFNLRGRRDNA